MFLSIDVELNPQQEFDFLRSQGYTGTINDMRRAFLLNLGFSGSINDQLGQYFGTPSIISQLTSPVAPSITEGDTLSIASFTEGTYASTAGTPIITPSVWTQGVQRTDGYVFVAGDIGTTEYRESVTDTAGTSAQLYTLNVTVLVGAVSLRSAVEAQLTAVGRTSTATLKDPVVDAEPGMTVATDLVTLAQAGATYSDFDFTNRRVLIDADNITLEQSIVGGQIGGSLKRAVQVDGRSGVTVRNVTTVGSPVERYDGPAHMILQLGAVSNPPVLVDRILMTGLASDGTGADGMKVERTVISQTVPNYPDDVTVYDPAVTYSAGDVVWFDNSLTEVAVSLVDSNLGNPLPPNRTSSNAFFEGLDPHFDALGQKGSEGESHIAYSYVESETAEALGQTQNMRYIRNSRTATRMDEFVMQGVVFSPVNPTYGPIYPLGWQRIRNLTGTFNTGGNREYIDGSGNVRWFKALNDAQTIDVGNANTFFNDTLNWVETFDVNAPGPIVLRHCWFPPGRNGLYFRNDQQDFPVVFDNVRSTTTEEVLTYPWAVIDPTPEPAIGDPVVKYSGAGTYSATGNEWLIEPTAYSACYDTTGVATTAVIFQIEDRNVLAIEADGTVTVLNNVDLSVTDNLDGTWTVFAPSLVGDRVSGRMRTFCGTATITASTVSNAAKFAIVSQSEPAVGMMITRDDTTSLYTQQAYPAPAAGLDAAIVSRETNISTTATDPAAIVIDNTAIANKDVSPGIVAFANLWHTGSGGEALRVADITDPGTSAIELADDDDTGRNASIDRKVVTLFNSLYGDVEDVLLSWWNAEASAAKTLIASRSAEYVGLNSGGSDDVSGTYESPIIDLSAANPNRGILPSTARFSMTLPGIAYPTAPSALTDLSATPNVNYDTQNDGTFINGMTKQNADPAVAQRQAFIDWLPGANQGATGISPALVKFGDYTGGVKDADGQSLIHPSVKNPDGQILFAQDIAVQSLVARGHISVVPNTDRWEYATDGSNVVAHIRIPPNGTLTTKRKEDGGSVASPRPHQQLDGMGFEIWRAGDTIHTKQPVWRTDSNENVDYRAAVAITDAGSDVGGGVWEAQVTITPTTPFADGDQVEFGASGQFGAFNIFGLADYEADLYLDGLRVHLAALDDGTSFAYPGIPVRPQDISQAASGIVAPSAEHLVKGADSYFVDTANLGTGVTRIVNRGTFNFPTAPANGAYFFAQESTGNDLTCLSGNKFRVTVEQDGGAKLISSAVIQQGGSDYTFATGVDLAIVMDTNWGAGTFDMAVNGVAMDQITFAPGQVAEDGRELSIGANSSGGAQLPTGTQMSNLSIEKNGVLHKAISNTAATANADPWKGGVDGFTQG